MRFLNIASGSSGNSTYVGADNTHVLIDCGLSKKKIEEGLATAQLSLDDIDGILITHEHADHISSLGVLERKREIPVYATAGTIEEIKKCKSLGSFSDDVFVPIESDKDFWIKDLQFRALRTSHDGKEPVCYRFWNNLRSAAIVTDLGVYNDYLATNLKDLDLLMLESNHDKRMLEVGPYPYPLKRRILGEFGHLSNEDSGRFLSQLLHDNMVKVILGHISRENNTRDLAKWSVEEEINESETPYKAGDFEILTARHDRMLDLIEV
ncbi:MAG: MBL fold metallo-hydrolase [Lachnospiraceae bacterium]|nr:MBL fold metallo-hydrolase [Lachnospiraceae bacterium]